MDVMLRCRTRRQSADVRWDKRDRGEIRGEDGDRLPWHWEEGRWRVYEGHGKDVGSLH